jgi:hypothetical protein
VRTFLSDYNSFADISFCYLFSNTRPLDLVGRRGSLVARYVDWMNKRALIETQKVKSLVLFSLRKQTKTNVQLPVERKQIY